MLASYSMYTSEMFMQSEHICYNIEGTIIQQKLHYHLHLDRRLDCKMIEETR